MASSALPPLPSSSSIKTTAKALLEPLPRTSKSRCFKCTRPCTFRRRHIEATPIILWFTNEVVHHIDEQFTDEPRQPELARRLELALNTHVSLTGSSNRNSHEISRVPNVNTMFRNIENPNDGPPLGAF